MYTPYKVSNRYPVIIFVERMGFEPIISSIQGKHLSGFVTALFINGLIKKVHSTMFEVRTQFSFLMREGSFPLSHGVYTNMLATILNPEWI